MDGRRKGVNRKYSVHPAWEKKQKRGRKGGNLGSKGKGKTP